MTLWMDPIMNATRSFLRAARILRRTVVTAASIAAVACAGAYSPGSEARPSSPFRGCLAMPEAASLSDGGVGSSEWNDVVIDDKGRLWLAGYRDGIVGESNIEPSGPSRAVIRLLAPDGETLRNTDDLFRTGFTDVAEAMALDRSGALYVVGRTKGHVTGGWNAGQFDTVVAWSEVPTGKGAWRLQQFGNERPQHPRRIRVADDGDLVVAGYDDEYVPSNYVAAWADPFAVRLTRGIARRDGLLLRWQHQFASVEPDTVDGLVVDAMGASYVSGAVQSGAKRGMFVRKLDAAGHVLWNARYSATPVDNIAAMELLADGSLLVAGSVYGAFQGAPPAGEQDVFVARISPLDGSVLQRWQYGTSGSEWLVDMKLGRDGSIYLLGETSGAFIADQPPGGSVDLFVLKLSTDGRLLARRQLATGASPWTASRSSTERRDVPTPPSFCCCTVSPPRRTCSAT